MATANAQVHTSTVDATGTPPNTPPAQTEHFDDTGTPPTTMYFGEIQELIQDRDVEAHRRAGWTSDAPNNSTPA